MKQTNETKDHESIRSRLDCVVILLFLALFIGCGKMEKSNAEITIEWLGWPVYATEYQGIDPGFYRNGAPPTQLTRDNIEIGLRSDGIVVWKNTGKEK